MAYENTIAGVAENIQIFGQLVLAHLRNTLALVGSVARNYPGANDASSHGSIINIPNLIMSGSARTRAVGGAVTIDPISSVNTQVTMQQVYKAITVDNLQMSFTNLSLVELNAIRMATQLADGVDSNLIANWYKIPYEVGTDDGTAAFNSTDKMNVLAAARKVLSVNKAPLDRLQAVLNPTEAYNIRTLDIYNQAQQSGDPNLRMSGALGKVVGFQLRESQASPGTVTLTTDATWGTPLVDLIAGYAIGATTIHVDGLGAGDIKQGTVFTLGGNNYSVTADVTTGGAEADIVITPPLKTAVLNDAVITWESAAGTNGLLGGHSAAGSVGFAYDPDALLLVVRPEAPFMEGTGVRAYTFTDTESGLSFRLAFQSKLTGAAGVAMQEEMVGSILVGTQLVNPELAVRISGQI